MKLISIKTLWQATQTFAREAMSFNLESHSNDYPRNNKAFLFDRWKS